jgi:transposase-like protein
MSLALKLDRARQTLEYWRRLAEESKLSPAAAQRARDHVRSCQAAVTWYEKAFGYQERNRQGRARRTLGG